MTKQERRRAAKANAARAARARQLRQILNYVVVGLVVAGLIVGAYFYFGRSGKPAATASTASASPGASQAAAPFPPLPDGADPALQTKPTVSAGTGDLKKLTPTVLIAGKGAATQNGQELTVNYVGVSYKTGQEFDSSWKANKAFTFTLGQGGVIKGWDQGLVGVKVGSRVQLDIPSDLAYGDNGNPGGPLRFVVDVLGAK
jgi:peptidylprolyl isomerase